jgi:subtilisin family serine protease
MTTSAAKQSRFGAAFDWLGVERAWTRTRGSADVLIAIVDRGVQLDHPLLGPNIQRDRSHPAVSVDSHEIAGTHAAGVAAGRACEVESFSGVAPGARLLPVRFSDTPGASSEAALDLAHAIEYAVEMGACIINVSHAGDLARASVQRAIQYAATRNALVVCSAAAIPPGRKGSELLADGVSPNLISVVSLGEDLRPISNYHDGAAHIAAPGFARVPHWRGTGHNSHMADGIGAPYVSGCAALVKSLNPGWGYHEIKEHLLASGQAHPELAGKCQGGRVLNVANAVIGPLEFAEDIRALSWSSLNDAELHWKLRYRSALCVHAVALYRPNGDEHWRELAHARASNLKMSIPASALRRSSGILRLATRDSNFHCQDVELTIR